MVGNKKKKRAQPQKKNDRPEPTCGTDVPALESMRRATTLYPCRAWILASSHWRFEPPPPRQRHDSIHSARNRCSTQWQSGLAAH